MSMFRKLYQMEQDIKTTTTHESSEMIDTSFDLDNFDYAIDHQTPFISFVRHPISRLLAGYAQVEVFVHLGWFDVPIIRYNLTWWKDNSSNTTWGHDDGRTILHP